MRIYSVFKNCFSPIIKCLTICLLLHFGSIVQVSGQNYYFYNETSQSFSIDLVNMDNGQSQSFTILPGRNDLGAIDIGASFKLSMPYMRQVIEGTLSFYWGCTIMNPQEWIESGYTMYLDDYFFPDPDACNYLMTLGIHPNNAPPPPPPPTDFELVIYNGTSQTFEVHLESLAFIDEQAYKQYTINPGVNILDGIEEGAFRLFLPYKEDIATGATKIIWNCNEVAFSEIEIKDWGMWIDKEFVDQGCPHMISFIPDPVHTLSISVENNTSTNFPIKLKQSTGEEYMENVFPGQSSIGPISSGQYELFCDYSPDLFYGFITLEWNGVKISPEEWIVEDEQMRLISRHISSSHVFPSIRFNPAAEEEISLFQSPDLTQHYQQVTTFRQAMTGIPTRLSPLQAMRKVTYYDGFGRSKQLVMSAHNPYRRDVIVPVSYDEAESEIIEYLPYIGRGEVSSFRKTAFTEQKAFHKYPLPNIAATEDPYTKSKLVASSSTRIKEQGSVGTLWQPNSGSGKTIKFDILYNTVYSPSDNLMAVRRFWVDTITNSLIDRTSTGNIVYYSPNEVAIDIIKGVHWTEQDGRLNTTESYTDKAGKKLLERSFNKDENDNLITFSTYYVYNSADELCFILPPALAPDTSALSQIDLDRYAIQFGYDRKGRKTMEKQPGIEPHFLVYNKYDQLVALQNPNQRRDSIWSFIKYDYKGRIIMEGLTKYIESASTLRQEIDSVSDTYEMSTFSTNIGYTDNVWPSQGESDYATIYYYDNYDQIPGVPVDLKYKDESSGDKVDFPTGLQTAVRTYSDTGKEFWTVNYYNQKGNLIQVHSNNHLGGRDMVGNIYSFVGELINSTREHYDENNQLKLTLKNSYSYDHVGRPLYIKQKVDNQDEVTLVAYSYNEIGQLIDRKLHKKAGQTKYLQSVDYRYHEKGWLKSINDPNLQVNSACNDGDTDSNADFFGMKLVYNEDSIMPQYNGNIAAMQWKTSQVQSQFVAPPKMGYQYRYDGLNRMVNAISERNDQVDNSHNEEVTYDVTGNILSLERKAYIGGDTEIIDDLVYTYDGYRAKSIDDRSSSAFSSLGFKELGKLTDEYVYDANGNMIEDKNKGITLTYNSRNLVSKITFEGDANHTLEFLYDRGGKKLRAKYTYPNGVYTIDYLDGIQYQQGRIAFLHTGEGRARWNGSKYIYEYDLKDHLGNVRVTFSPDPNDQSETTAQVIQQNSYYPYGMPMYGDSDNGLHLAFVSGEKSNYLYSGKELYDQGGLDWFDHGSRMYDPAIGRWSVMDPASQFINPYLAMGNNPVVGVDPNGEFWHIVVGAVVGVIGNGVGNAMKGDPFFRGWAGAAIMGGVGSYSASVGIAGTSAFSTSWSTTMAGMSTYPSTFVNSLSSNLLSSYNASMSIGNFSMGVSPSIFMGMNGWGFGLNFSGGYSSDNFDFGISTGYTYWNRNIITKSSFLEHRVGAQIAGGGKNFKAGLATMNFGGGGISQRTGSVAFYGKDWSIRYENDWLGYNNFSLPLGDGGDRWRTTGIYLSAGDVSTTLLMATGDPSDGVNLVNRPQEEINGKNTYTGENANMFRLGSWTFGYKGYSVGTNSEYNRGVFQNKVAHGDGKTYAIFPELSNMVDLDFFYRTRNPYTSW